MPKTTVQSVYRQNASNLTKIFHLWAPVPNPLSDQGHIYHTRVDLGVRFHAKFHLDRFIVSLLKGGKLQIWPHLQLQHTACLAAWDKVQRHQDHEFERPNGDLAFTKFTVLTVTDKRKLETWADAQGDGRPAEYRWRRLRKFRNSIPCTTLQSLADVRCWSAVQ